MDMEKAKSLEGIRYNIDLIDRSIIQLLSERSSFVAQAASFKNSHEEVEAKDRVEQVIDKVRNLAYNKKLNPDIAERIYRTIISTFIEHEKQVFEKN